MSGNQDAVPVPELRVARFERLAFGMFIHWGLYSQLGQGEWIQSTRRIPKEEYARLQTTFRADTFDARAIARTARRAGMGYITLTARHHDGFSLYDTRGLNRFDSVHSPAGRDLVAEFVEACRAEGILPVLYHTTLDWSREEYASDFGAYLDYLYKSVELLCTHYGPIGGLWFDGNWDRPNDDWRLDELYGMIRRLQPEALIVNNTGLGHRGELGHPEIDSVTYEQGRPKPMNRAGMKKYVAAEMCETMNDHWGIGSRDFMYKSLPHLIESLCACRKAGANYLLNVGLTAGGSIPKIQEAMLELMGDWLELNGRAIYDGRPSAVEGEGGDFALEGKDGKLYLFIHRLKIRGDSNVTVNGGGAGEKRFTGLHRPITSIRWLDSGDLLEFQHEPSSGELRVVATGFPYGVNLVVRIAEVE